MAESQEYSIMLVKDKNGNKHFVPDILESEKAKKKKDRTTYCCYVCGNELSFHSGLHIRPYYQHKSGEKCDYSNESDIHKRYKEILSRPGQQFQVGDIIYTVKNAEVEKSFSVLESWIKTDLFVKTEEGKDFIFEIAYRNKKKGYEYLKKWRLLGFDVIELNINEQEEIITDCASDNIDKVYKCKKLYDAKTGEYCGEIPKEYGILVMAEEENELVRKYLSLPEVNDFIEFVNQNYNEVEQIVKQFGKLSYVEQDFICRKIICKSHQSLKNKLENSKYGYCQKMEQKQEKGITFYCNFKNKTIYKKLDNCYIQISTKNPPIEETVPLTKDISDKKLKKYVAEKINEADSVEKAKEIVCKLNSKYKFDYLHEHFELQKKDVIYKTNYCKYHVCKVDDPDIENKCKAKLKRNFAAAEKVAFLNEKHHCGVEYSCFDIQNTRCDTDKKYIVYINFLGNQYPAICEADDPDLVEKCESNSGFLKEKELGYVI